MRPPLATYIATPSLANAQDLCQALVTALDPATIAGQDELAVTEIIEILEDAFGSFNTAATNTWIHICEQPVGGFAAADNKVITLPTGAAATSNDAVFQLADQASAREVVSHIANCATATAAETSFSLVASAGDLYTVCAGMAGTDLVAIAPAAIAVA